MVTHLWMPEKSLWQIFVWPIVYALCCAAGLVLALVIDDSRELLADAVIAMPLIAVIYYLYLMPYLRRKAVRFSQS